MSEPVKVKYDAPPTLHRFLCSDAFVRCVLGPVGSGKSSASVVEILRRAVEQKPGPDGVRRTRFAVIRNTYGQLRDTTRKTFEQWIPQNLGTWHEQEFSFELEFNDVHCEVLFRALDRPEDVNKLLSLELTGAYINEGREISKSVFEVLQTRVGRYPSKAQGGPTWFGVWMDTNPWHSGHWASRLFKQHPEGHELFRQPGGRASDAENVENLPDGYYARLCFGKDAEWVKVYVDGLDATSDVGSVYGHLLSQLDARGGVAGFDYEPDSIFTSWDIGGAGARGDSTAIWFWRLNDKGMPDLVDYYEANGRPMSHYFDLIEGKGYHYIKHWFPHDARAKTLQTGSSILEQTADRWGAENVAITPQLSLADGIQASRWLLEQPMRIHTDAMQGLECLQEYRYEWNEADRCFSNTPLHNWASHGADAFRYLACVVKTTELLTRKPVQLNKPAAVPLDQAFTLENLWQQHDRSNRGRGRI